MVRCRPTSHGRSTFRRPRFRGLQRHESEASTRCAADAAHRCSLGGVVVHDILREVWRASLVQHSVSVTKKTLIAGVAALLLSAGATHACELEVKILKSNALHVLEKCAGVETFHQDLDFYHPWG